MSLSRSNSLPKQVEGGYQEGSITAQWPVKVIAPRWEIMWREHARRCLWQSSIQSLCSQQLLLNRFVPQFPFLPQGSWRSDLPNCEGCLPAHRTRAWKGQFPMGSKRQGAWAERRPAPCCQHPGDRSSREHLCAGWDGLSELCDQTTNHPHASQWKEVTSVLSLWGWGLSARGSGPEELVLLGAGYSGPEVLSQGSLCTNRSDELFSGPCTPMLRTHARTDREQNLELPRDNWAVGQEGAEEASPWSQPLSVICEFRAFKQQI